MSIKDILNELKNIKEQAVNEQGIGKESILEALTDLIHDIGGNDGLDGFNFDDEDGLYDTFESIDFSELQVWYELIGREIPRNRPQLGVDWVGLRGLWCMVDLHSYYGYSIRLYMGKSGEEWREMVENTIILSVL